MNPTGRFAQGFLAFFLTLFIPPVGMLIAPPSAVVGAALLRY